MYSGGGGGRIYNPRPDPLERGPPKRVLRDETHIGEMVAASKKRISWRFTLGESDTVHEVVLTHSIMSYKKVSDPPVEEDGGVPSGAGSDASCALVTTSPCGWDGCIFFMDRPAARGVRRSPDALLLDGELDADRMFFRVRSV
jgi:hypothetical protein